MKKTDLIDQLRQDWHNERPDLDSKAMGIVGRAILLGELMRKSANQALLDFDLGYTDLDVLATIRRSGKPFVLRPADLLKAVLIQSGSLTACLDRLEKAGHIERVATPNDRRSRSVKLTSQGKALIDKAIAVRFQEADNLIAELTTSERETLENLLRKLLVSIAER